MGFPGGSVVKIPLAKQEAQVRSLGWEDPLQKEMATHSSILAWEIPWTEEPGGLQSMESQRVGYDLATEQQQHLLFHQNHGSKNLGCTRNELVVTDHLCEQV